MTEGHDVEEESLMKTLVAITCSLVLAVIIGKGVSSSLQGAAEDLAQDRVDKISDLSRAH